MSVCELQCDVKLIIMSTDSCHVVWWPWLDRHFQWKEASRGEQLSSTAWADCCCSCLSSSFGFRWCSSPCQRRSLCQIHLSMSQLTLSFGDIRYLCTTAAFHHLVLKLTRETYTYVISMVKFLKLRQFKFCLLPIQLTVMLCDINLWQNRCFMMSGATLKYRSLHYTVIGWEDI